MERNINDEVITINDIAAKLGLSKTTVSRAISGRGRVGEQTRQRVLECIEENNFQPNQIAKSLAENKTFNIGAIVPQDELSIEMPFFQKCLMGASGAAAARDYDILVVADDNEKQFQLERVLRNRKVDGFILTRVLVEDPQVKLLKQHGVPFVVIGSFHDAEVVQVDHDHRQAACTLTGRLLDEGMDSIAFIGENLESVVNLNRYQGYVDALAAQGRQVDNSRVRFVQAREQIAGAVREVLAAGAKSILCMDDFICSHVLSALNQQKLRVPQDVKVASLYNSVVLADYTPPVTAVNFDVELLGKTACHLLLDMLEGAEVPPKTLLDYEVVLKESTLA